MEQVSKKRISKFLAASYVGTIVTSTGSTSTTQKQEPFEKGRIAESLTQRYDNKPTLDLTLTGAEIKVKIPNVLSVLRAYVTELQAKCQVAEASAGKPPHRQRTSYLFSQVGGMTYDYGDFDTKWDEMTKAAIPRTTEQEAMYLHNRCCEEWITIQEDIVALRALQSTLIDDKTYNLTVSQIVSLGFGLQEEPSGIVTVEEFTKGEAVVMFEFEKGGYEDLNGNRIKEAYDIQKHSDTKQ